MGLFVWWLLMTVTSGVVLGDAPYPPPPPKDVVPMPYATSYSEPPGFGVQTGYEGYLVAQPENEANALTALNELLGLFAPEKDAAPATSLQKPSPGWALLPLLAKLAFPLQALLKFGLWVVAPLSLVLLGGALAVGVCAFTPVCTLSFLTKDNMRSFLTPDRLAYITTFVQDAINKYQLMQKKVLKKERQMRKLAERRIETTTQQTEK